MDYVLAVAFLATVIWHLYESRQWTKERTRLLDRVMARDFDHYKTYEGAERPHTFEPILSDEQEAAIYGKTHQVSEATA